MFTPLWQYCLFTFQIERHWRELVSLINVEVFKSKIESIEWFLCLKTLKIHEKYKSNKKFLKMSFRGQKRDRYSFHFFSFMLMMAYFRLTFNWPFTNFDLRSKDIRVFTWPLLLRRAISKQVFLQCFDT